MKTWGEWARAASFVVLMVSWALLSGAQETDPVSDYRVRDFGAAGDGTTNDTAAVQRAIDACAAGGGGSVHFGAGLYLCGSLHLRSRVTLWLDAGATIQGCPNKKDYDPYETLDFENNADHETSYFHYALIWGEDIEHVAIVGQGTIDGNRTRRGGPKPIALKRCRHVAITGIHIVNAPNYAISLLGTDYVCIDGVTILNAYCDGIDPDACHNVRIANCHIESVDDAIVPKASFSLGKRRSSENITVTNCYLATACQAFKLGTESGGDFKCIAVSNCVMSGLGPFDDASAGIALETVDGAHLDGVVISNITMTNVEAPILLRLGNRGRDMETPVPGTLKNVVISDIVATGASMASSISGIPGHKVEGVTLANIRLVYKGGSAYRAADEPVPEAIDAYPAATMFGALPAYGLYCRHVDGLTLSNVQLQYEDPFWRRATKKGGTPQPGRPGPALVCDDVHNVTIDTLGARACPEGDAVIRFANVSTALVRGCVAPKDARVFLEVVGAGATGIRLIGNALDEAAHAVILGGGVPAHAVVLAANTGVD